MLEAASVSSLDAVDHLVINKIDACTGHSATVPDRLLLKADDASPSVDPHTPETMGVGNRAQPQRCGGRVPGLDI